MQALTNQKGKMLARNREIINHMNIGDHIKMKFSSNKGSWIQKS